MRSKILKILTFLSLLQTSLYADDWDFLSVNGYGTVGVAYQNNENVLFRNSFFTGKGSKGDIAFENYSVVGLQFDAKATEKLSFTLQAVASANNANGNLLDVDWANAKYQINDAFDLRVGMMRTPIFMYSDILNVAYSYEMLRLPDMYGLISINKYQGAELNHRVDFDASSLYSTLFAGETYSDYKAVDGSNNIVESDIHAKNIFGIGMKFIYNDLTLRSSYLVADLNIESAQMEGVFNQFSALNIPTISNTIDKYRVQNQKISYLNFGARYDFENSYLQAEHIRSDSKSFIVDLNAMYVTAGYNFDTWTPYVVYAKSKTTSNYLPISTVGMPVSLVGAITAANQAFTQIAEGGSEMNMETVSLGFRYDLTDSAVLKFQYDKQERMHETLNVFSSAVNFVF